MFQMVDNFLIINLNVLKGFFIINYMLFMLLGELVLILLLVMLLRGHKPSKEVRLNKKIKHKPKRHKTRNNKP